MLSFIDYVLSVITDKVSFKYISCYLLSEAKTTGIYHIDLFKYISCYLLSYLPHHFCHVPLWFKYISCYLLSEMCQHICTMLNYLNTSHVIFYPTILSHFSIIILRKSLYFSRFLLYFTTLRQFFQIYFESTCFPLYLLGFLDFSVFPPGKITGLMFLHYPLHRFLRLLYWTRCHSLTLTSVSNASAKYSLRFNFFQKNIQYPQVDFFPRFLLPIIVDNNSILSDPV